MLSPNRPALNTAPAVGDDQPDSPDTLSPSPSVSQKLNLGTPDIAAPSQAIAPEDIPDILMQEVQAVEEECKNNYFYSSFHDCRCVAVKFLDARLKSDPNVPRDRIFNQVAAQCPDEPAIAGFVYRSCAEYMKDVRSDFDSFCTCTANNVARAYTKTPVINLRYIENLRHNALSACGIANNPDIKPYVPE